MFKNEFPELFQRYNELKVRMASLADGSAARPPAEGFKAKMIAAAVGAKEMAQTKGREFQINSVLCKLGEAAFEAHGEQSGPVAFVKPITKARERIAVLDEEIDNLSKSKPGQLLTPKRTVFSGIAAVLIVSFSLAYWHPWTAGTAKYVHMETPPLTVPRTAPTTDTPKAAEIDDDQAKTVRPNLELLTPDKTSGPTGLARLGFTRDQCLICGSDRSGAAKDAYSDRRGFGFCEDCGRQYKTIEQIVSWHSQSGTPPSQSEQLLVNQFTAKLKDGVQLNPQGAGLMLFYLTGQFASPQWDSLTRGE